MKESCESCYYFEKNYSLCRRHPPFLTKGENVIYNLQPQVLPGDWCGEYKIKKIRFTCSECIWDTGKTTWLIWDMENSIVPIKKCETLKEAHKEIERLERLIEENRKSKEKITSSVRQTINDNPIS